MVIIESVLILSFTRTLPDFEKKSFLLSTVASPFKNLSLSLLLQRKIVYPA